MITVLIFCANFKIATSASNLQKPQIS